MKEVELIIISRVDYEDETSNYVAKMTPRFKELKHITGVGESPFTALSELEEAVDMYMESIKKSGHTDVRVN
jgi:predicted RNase H-like HicB family nuclease